MSARVIRLRDDDQDVVAAAEVALDRTRALLESGSLSEHTVRAYRTDQAAYVEWLRAHAASHADAFRDQVGADGAVTAWKRRLIAGRLSAATVGRKLAAVKLLYRHGAGLVVTVKGPRIEPPGEPDTLTDDEQARLQREAARSSARNNALIAVLLYSGVREAECAALDLVDVQITPRTGTVRVRGKGDQIRTVPLPLVARERVSAWLDGRGTDPGPLWLNDDGKRLGVEGIVAVVLTLGARAGIEGLRPHDLRHCYATRCRQAGMDQEQIRALMGHRSITTTARYFRAGQAELAAAVESTFEQ